MVLPIRPLLMNSAYTAAVTAAGGSAGMGFQPPGAPGPVHLGPVGPHTGCPSAAAAPAAAAQQSAAASRTAAAARMVLVLVAEGLLCGGGDPRAGSLSAREGKIQAQSFFIFFKAVLWVSRPPAMRNGGMFLMFLIFGGARAGRGLTKGSNSDRAAAGGSRHG